MSGLSMNAFTKINGSLNMGRSTKVCACLCVCVLAVSSPICDKKKK